MQWSRFESAMQYVGFDASSEASLQELLPFAEPRFPAIVDDFYAALLNHPDANAAITGGPTQVERLKQTLLKWLHQLLHGPHDEEYLEARNRIGKVHVRIGLPQEYMLTAMNRIRLHLLDCVQSNMTGARSSAAMRAVNQILDLELVIMLDSYQENWMARVRVGERFATIGQFAASIGHELRNPLGVVESSLFLIAQRLQRLNISDPVLNKHQQRISEQVRICGATISSLLELARDSAPSRAYEDARAIVASALASIAVPDTVHIEQQIPEGLLVFADASQLRQVIGNLVWNAVQATNERGRISIRAGAHNGGVEIWVIDDGPGIPTENRRRVFDLLFTTRASGTGLGLALCRKIVDAHQGEVSLEPSDTGAHFRVWIGDGETAPEHSS